MAETEGHCTLPVTQTMLAYATGVTPVHVNRVLEVLRSDGIAQHRQRTLEIRDWARLRALAEFDSAYLHLDAQGA